MPFLSPAKLLVVLVVALLVLGPDKLPKAAQQIGGFWGEFRRFRQKLEAEVRHNLPDLPSSEVIVQAARSPLSLLDVLAQDHDRKGEEPDRADIGSPEVGPSQRLVRPPFSESVVGAEDRSN